MVNTAKNIRKITRNIDKRSMLSADVKEKVTHYSDGKIMYESDKKLVKK